MLRLVSSLVLVLLVWEGEAQLQLRQHNLYPCLFVAGNAQARDRGDLGKKELNGTNLLFEVADYNVTLPGDSESFEQPITSINVFDLLCLRTEASPGDFALIKSGGVGKRQVSITFSIPGRSRYDYVVIVRGKRS